MHRTGMHLTAQTTPYTVGFILEQTLGHITHSANLRQNVPADPTVRAVWGLVPWEAEGLTARLPVYRSNWTVRAGLRARRLLDRMQREARLDALFVHTQVPAIFLADRLGQIPSVVSLDATPLQYDALGEFYNHPSSADWLETQKRRLNRLCFQRAHRLVTWSQWAAASLTADYGIPAEKITVIPPGVNTDAWARPGSMNVDGDTVKILFVGGDLSRKGGHLLLEAVRRLRALLASEGIPLQLELHLVTRSETPDEPGVFVYRTMQPNSAELKALFHACDIFCLPTLGDCLPMVLSEAGAAQLPLIATDVAAISEIVQDGHTGLLVAPGDLEDLVVALYTLVAQPAMRVQFGENARHHVRRHYDAVHNTHQLLDLIKQTVDEARVPGVVPTCARPIGVEHGHG